MRLRYTFALGLLVVVGVLAYMFVSRIDRELECLAKTIYFEARLEPELGQRLVAHSVMERVRSNDRQFGPSTICGVVFYGKKKGKGKFVPQYSWTLLSRAEQAPRNKERWERSLQLAREARGGTWQPDEKFKGAMWYLNPKASEKKNVCWFRKTFVSIEPVASHEFFRMPATDSERLGLLALDPEECKPPLKKKKKQEASR